jgi:quinol monooxygenase YgiN
MKSVIVSYTVKPEFAEQNAANIRAVMEELQALGNPGIRYQAFRCKEDGNSFRHIAFHADDAASQAMSELNSFKKFQQELKASAPVQPPKPEWLEMVAAGHEIFG